MAAWSLLQGQPNWMLFFFVSIYVGNFWHPASACQVWEIGFPTGVHQWGVRRNFCRVHGVGYSFKLLHASGLVCDSTDRVNLQALLISALVFSYISQRLDLLEGKTANFKNKQWWFTQIIKFLHLKSCCSNQNTVIREILFICCG